VATKKVIYSSTTYVVAVFCGLWRKGYVCMSLQRGAFRYHSHDSCIRRRMGLSVGDSMDQQQWFFSEQLLLHSSICL
jgi:hypothetical protein